MAPLFKKYLSVMAMTASVFVLIACGGGGDAEPANTPPTATAGSVNAGVEPSKTFSLTSQIGDAETPNNLTIVVVQAPTKGTLSINGASVTYSMNAGQAGDDFFTFKVRDPSGAESPTVRQDLINFDNA